MSRKKIAILIIVLVLAVSAGTAFYFLRGRDNKDANRYTDEDDFQSLKQESLTFYMPGKEPKMAREVLDQVQDKSRDKVNIKLDIKWIDWSVYYTGVRNAIASNAPCDAFYYFDGDGYDGNSLKKLAQEGLLLDISQLFPGNAPGYYREFSREELQSVTVNGKLYGIPNKFPMSGRKCVLVRDDLLNKYGIKDINGYDELEAFFDKVKTGEAGVTPVSSYDTAIGLFAESYGYVIFNYPLGIVYKLDDPQMKLMAWEQVPEYKQAMARIRKWKEKGYTYGDSFFTTPDRTLVTSGLFASIISQVGSSYNINSFLKSSTGRDWKYVELDLYPGKKTVRNSPANGSLVFGANSKNAGRAIMFMEWLQSSQENYDLFMYGVKGKHYALKGEQLDAPEGVKQDDMYMNWGGRTAFVNLKYERVNAGTDSGFVKQYLASLEAKTVYPPHLGFYADYDSVKNIAIPRAGSFFNMELRPPALLDEASIDEHIAGNRRTGADELVAAIQKQLDEWKAAKGK